MTNNIQPLIHSFLNFELVSCSMSSSNCCFLFCIQASQETGTVVWYSHLFKNFPVCCDPHSQSFSIVNEADGEGNGTPLQYSCLENPMDGEACSPWVSEGHTRLSDFTFTFHFHALEKEMATHASILAWRIPGTEESVGLPSMGSHRVGHDWHNLAAEAAPPFWTLFHLPPHKISLGCSRALALGALLRALNWHW